MSGVVPGRCDFCPRPGHLVMVMCSHEHRVGVNVCAEKHAADFATGEIGCRICYSDVPSDARHFCPLREAP